MEVSNQLQAPAALPPGKKSSAIERRPSSPSLYRLSYPGQIFMGGRFKTQQSINNLPSISEH
jgi:hypothetical protein